MTWRRTAATWADVLASETPQTVNRAAPAWRCPTWTVSFSEAAL